MFVDEDRIIREIRRIAEAVARAVGVRTKDAEEEADTAIGELHRTLFGLDASATRRLHPSSLAAMVSPHHRDAAVELLRAEARLLEARGEHGLAALRDAQADALV